MEKAPEPDQVASRVCWRCLLDQNTGLDGGAGAPFGELLLNMEGVHPVDKVGWGTKDKR